MSDGKITPELLTALVRTRELIPPDLLTSKPELKASLDSLVAALGTQPRPISTIFDILPTFFGTAPTMHALMEGVAAVTGSALPGFGGSLALVGVGLVGRLLANRIASARVEDQRSAANVAPLPNSST